MSHATPGAVGYANDSGWMKQPEFVLFMRHFINHSRSSKQQQTLLLIDKHQSHLSVEALDMAAEYGVTILSFPPHCSHKMQPLDVSVYGPVKTYYEQKCRVYERLHPLQGLLIAAAKSWKYRRDQNPSEQRNVNRVPQKKMRFASYAHNIYRNASRNKIL